MVEGYFQEVFVARRFTAWKVNYMVQSRCGGASCFLSLPGTLEGC